MVLRYTILLNRGYNQSYNVIKIVKSALLGSSRNVVVMGIAHLYEKLSGVKNLTEYEIELKLIGERFFEHFSFYFRLTLDFKLDIYTLDNASSRTDYHFYLKQFRITEVQAQLKDLTTSLQQCHLTFVFSKIQFDSEL